ncbi:MAG TPA: PEP/pyruvate-binding domain-containing protein, partial [Levilinea sp.]|nr:PEP/pyruvate-binding domain-containing protein [Levilinea sp.]
MSFSPSSTDRLLSIYLALAQYPILSERIRTRMRNMLFERGIITPQAFELQVRDLAVRSQEREGLRNPFEDEQAETWDLRISRIRNQYTDLIFSRHMKYEDFERIVEAVLSERGVSNQDIMVAFNPELAPTEQVFQQAMTIEHLPREERAKNEARLREMKVVLIRTLISDQLPYINIAREWFTIADLAEIRRRKIGLGRIGGKAAGMLLALRVLKEMAGQDLQQCLASAPSYFVGADLMYSFMSLNNLTHWNDQKYKSEEEMRAEYPQIIREFELGDMIPELLDKLTGVLVDVGNQPLIVRSSSLLEDNFGTAFAGKYESVFLPNQRSLQQNLRDLVRGMARIYASTLNPNALLYRRSRGLQDYDERMAILIQVVQGEQFGRYYLPHA